MSRVCNLIETACESQRIGLYDETALGKGRRDQLGTAVRETDAEIQSGRYFGPAGIDWVVILHLVVFSIIVLLLPHRRKVERADRYLREMDRAKQGNEARKTRGPNNLWSI